MNKITGADMDLARSCYAALKNPPSLLSEEGQSILAAMASMARRIREHRELIKKLIEVNGCDPKSQNAGAESEPVDTWLSEVRRRYFPDGPDGFGGTSS